jgi:iron complex outermembrane receptor protein
MRYAYLCILVLFSAYRTVAQECTLSVSGKVTDLHDGKPVSDAKIFIKGTSIQAITDSLGAYAFTDLCPGDWEFICQHHVGCEPVKKSIYLSENQEVDFSIEYHFLELEGAEVIHYTLDKSSVSVVKMSEIARLNGAGKTLGEQLKSLAGVTVLSTGASISKPVIHGLHSNRIVLMNNGVRQEGQQWGGEHAPEIDPFLSNDMSVIIGASAVKYGPEALGGVLLINPKPWNFKKRFSGEIFSGFSPNGRGYYLSGVLENTSQRIKGLSLRAHITGKKSGNINARDYYIGNTGVEELNFSAAALYTHKKQQFELFYSQFNTQLGIFSGSHIGNLSDLQAAFIAKEPLVKSSFSYAIYSPKQQINHGLFKVSWTSDWTKKQSTFIHYSLQSNDRREFDSDLGFGTKDSTTPQFRLLLTTQAIDFGLNSKWSNKLRTEVGVQLLQQENLREGRFLVPNFIKRMAGIYAIGHYNLKKWNFEAGVRGDYVTLDAFFYKNGNLVQPKRTFENTSATIGASHSFNHHFLVKFNSGLAWRPPSISELYSNGLHHGAAAIEVGSENLNKEQSFNNQVGAQYKSKKWTANLDVYHMQFQNYIYLKPNGIELTIKGAFPSFIYEQLKASYSGVDLSVEFRPIENWEYNGKYSIVRAYNRTENTFLIGIPADRLQNGITYTCLLEKGKKLRFSVNTEYVFKQNRFVTGIDFVDPPSDYLLLHGAINFELPIKKQTLQIGLIIDNALNKSYRDYMNRFRYFTDEMGRNIAIKLNYKF